jgi:tRNA1(Val) A37 N6-methylase TrmN6
MAPHDASAARRYFPRGLIQPAGTFRFAADALLLASFVRPAPGGALLDLGAGCGVVALGVLLRCPAMRAVGLDVQPELVAAAGQNADKLGFAARFSAVRADVRDMLRDGFPAGIRSGAFASATANPPYRVPGRGRPPASASRRAALFGGRDLLASFIGAGYRALAGDGSLYLVFPLEREEELADVLSGQGFFRRRLKRVVFREGAGRKGLLLLEAVKNAPPAPEWEEPLALHADEGEGSGLTREALAFCPWLQKNAPAPRPG